MIYETRQNRFATPGDWTAGGEMFPSAIDLAEKRLPCVVQIAHIDSDTQGGRYTFGQ